MSALQADTYINGWRNIGNRQPWLFDQFEMFFFLRKYYTFHCIVSEIAYMRTFFLSTNLKMTAKCSERRSYFLSLVFINVLLRTYK